MSLADLDGHPSRRCIRCGTTYPGLEAEAMFRLNPHDRRRRGQVHLSTTRKATCIACELTERTRRNAANRWLAKANASIAHHARRLGIPRERLRTDFGWKPELIAHDLEHAYANCCGYCDGRYDEMANGLADLTLDIVNPEDPPYYRTNVSPCCLTCNREKGRTPPHLFAAKRTGWERWRRNHAAWPEDSLFGDWNNS